MDRRNELQTEKEIKEIKETNCKTNRKRRNEINFKANIQTEEVRNEQQKDNKK